MTRKKGGGRESGEAIPPEGESGTVSPLTGRTASAAANPAACPFCGSNEGIVLHDGHLHERIRELEAELEALRKEAVEGSWRARAERAEKVSASLVECADECIALQARVKELIDSLRRVGRGPTIRGAVYLGPDLIIELRDLEGREREDLRGEDQG